MANECEIQIELKNIRSECCKQTKLYPFSTDKFYLFATFASNICPANTGHKTKVNKNVIVRSLINKIYFSVTVNINELQQKKKIN